MKKNFKKVVSIVLLACAILMMIPVTSMSETTSTVEETTISPRWSYIVMAESGLSINNGVATVDCLVKGHVNSATKAKVIAELQLKSGNSWMAYGTWTNTQNDYEAYVYQTKSVKAGQTYRVKATYTVWEGSQSETVVLFTDEKTA